MTKLAIFMHNNFEEIEAIATIDILRRAGYEVDIISVDNSKFIKGSHNIKIESELNLNDFNQDLYDGIIIPGGPGINELIENKIFLDLVLEFSKTKKMIAAICAAPQILGKLQLVDNKQITHFPGAENYLQNSKRILSEPTIIDENIITGKSAGSAVQFALNIVKYFDGEKRKEEIRENIITNYK